MKRLQLQKSKRHLNRISRSITPALILIIIALSYYLFVNRLKVFAVSNIEVSGTKTFVSEVDVRELVKSRAYEKNIMRVNSQDLERVLKETFQGAKEIRVSKKLPGTVSVIVTERQPIAVAYNRNSADEFLVDEDGYVLGVIAPGTTNFPKILYAEDIEVGYFLNARAMSVYFDLLKALEKEDVMVSSASVQEDHLLVFLRNSIEVLVGIQKDVNNSAKVLSQLLRQLATEGKTAKRVDLRYDKVVVSYD